MPARRELANAIRVLSMDAVQKANSGHPGMPMGMADIAEVLWNDFLKHNPKNPHWINRDRFILSNGHGSLLQYALLHLTGYDLTIDDIKQFRQLHSKTPGHPEFSETPGVETTTGPLGQGLANAVGMAIAEKRLAAEFNQENHILIDHHTYVFVGDGCLMEGISHEVCSLAGVLGLGKLICFYDDNRISIDGDVAGWFGDDTPKRFDAYGWHVVPAVDGHDSHAIRAAIVEARSVLDKPSLICCKTIIGWGAPNLAGHEKTHGSPLGDIEIAAARKKMGWDFPPFVIPKNIYDAWDATEKGKSAENRWQLQWEEYQKKYPVLAAELTRRLKAKLPENFEKDAMHFLEECQYHGKDMATRKASQLSIEYFATLLPELMGGSADLTESNNTRWKNAKTFSKKTQNGNYIYYGVREFGMTAIMNGIEGHGGFIPFGGTFLVFSDYARNAVRLAAMMKRRVIFVYTHDSIGLGEDGPTHQPIEQLASLRYMPNLSVWRPCDLVETAAAWQFALEHNSATALILSRQSLKHQSRDKKMLENIKRGGYILLDTEKTPDIIIIATGSEIFLAMEAAKQLNQASVRVVSMPSSDIFLKQSKTYQDHVLPPTIKKRLAIEAGVSDYWIKFVGETGKIIGINQFGASAPGDILFKTVGLTVDHVLNILRALHKGE